MTQHQSPILQAVASSKAVRSLLAGLPSPGETLALGGAVGSSGLAAVGVLHAARPNQVLVVTCPGPREADSAEADLEALLGPGHSYLFPQRESLPYESSERHLEVGGLRVEALEALFSRRTRLLVTTLRALQERAPVPTSLADLRITLEVDAAAGFRNLARALGDRGFDQVPLVEEVGQFAVRGGILDFFSFGSPEPIRVEFWEDKIVSMRAFDFLNQRSTRTLDVAHILPVDFHEGTGDLPVNRSLLELLPQDAILVDTGAQDWKASLDQTWEKAETVRRELLGQGHDPQPADHLFLPPHRALELMGGLPVVLLSQEPQGDFVLETEPPPSIDRDMSRLREYLVEGAVDGKETVILCDNDGQVQRLEEILGEGGMPPGVRLGISSLAGGFVLHGSSPPLRILTDHEIFKRARRIRRGRRFRGAAALESLAQLSPGDYVVHMDHGVGVFRGLKHLEVEGEEMEALAIEYAGGEILRVPVYRVDLVERWVGETDEARPPRVHRIGGRPWKTLKRKTEEAVAAMTSELLELYASRETAQGVAYSPDTRWQKEMESSFLYEDTPDQRTATLEVKRDMERPRPMDRLVCGDVGYGKTEVAVRAAFKAVQDGRQVAVLAPTTILVEQHRRSFEERLADYPVRVGALSRFRTAREQKELLLDLAQGRLDVVIGTHRLLSRDVVFKELGLLVVDEEQRFGVRHKERLKQLRASVDVLTLTATPIPRTLYLSLTGIRDLSLIQTPPRDRVPIITHVLPWS
ncbi:DEAD/DEAH box helicase, partial [Gemmatimonadota bacterium]